MLVLALDTTTRAGSCALARDGRVVREEASDAARAPASRLPRELEALLDRAGVALHEIDVLAAATGPGSFTGLRIGIATMQGLAMAAGKPLIGVSALDALCACGASPAGSPGEPDPGAPTAPAPWGGVARATKVERIATWIVAWRGEVYS
ncbi:MAG: tRNA (adenosine(37)-N6)-threonylcarbamoyltransferase complex dimerization subunit type 1 TsaB, partial [Acidobacteria bacterium]|nr:tRNA (adenosine(37)-N6)-threonylcarbamoyltransferase complex dimerization subunit type 1 TsaB [Acidobacteriota bacterium]